MSPGKGRSISISRTHSGCTSKSFHTPFVSVEPRKLPSEVIIALSPGSPEVGRSLRTTVASAKGYASAKSSLAFCKTRLSMENPIRSLDSLGKQLKLKNKKASTTWHKNARAAGFRLFHSYYPLEEHLCSSVRPHIEQ